MDACNIDRIRGFVALAASAMLLGGPLACATSPASQHPTSAESGVLSEIQVQREGDATVIGLIGAEDAVYTTFQREDPPRLIVDLPSVRAGGVAETTPVDDGFVDTVSVSDFGAGGDQSMTRITVALGGRADYELAPAGDRLEIRLRPADQPLVDEAAFDEAPTDFEAWDDPWADAETAATDPMAEDETPAAEAVVDAEPAANLLGVEVEELDGLTRIHLRADGTIDGSESFELGDPRRIVIDMPDLINTVSVSRIEAGTPHVERVRIGQHAEKVRVVLDAGASEAGSRMTPVADGLIVMLGDEAALAAMAPAPAADTMASDDAAVEEEPETATPASDPAPVESDDGLALVHAVEFESQVDRDRVTLTYDGSIQYLVYQPDPETVVLSLTGAAIEPGAAVNIAPDPGGPVSLVTSFQQPDVSTPEVRVVVKRAAGLAPEMNEQAGKLTLDFARSGGLAATPPVIAAARQAAPGAQGGMPGTTAAQSAGGLDAMPALASAGGAPAALPAAGAVMPAAIGGPELGTGILQEGGLYEGKKYTGRRISLDFKDAEIDNLLRLIAEVSDLNIIAGEEVEGKVTIRLVEIPWDQALDLVLLTKGLGFVRVGSVLRIAPVEVIKREEEARLQERRAKEKLEDLVVKLQPVNYADVQDVEKLVQRLLTPRGTVNVDERTNTIIIKDIASVIDEATALIKAIDTQTPQVMIEAKIVEANLDFSRELGSEFGFGTQPDEDFNDFSIGDTKPITVPDNKFPYNDANNIVFENPITSTATGILNLGAFILNDRAAVDFRITAAENNGEGKVISSPRVVTLDNKEATIEQGVSIPFQTFENGDAQLEFIDAVLSLTVTPHITADRSIIMEIAVSRDAPDDSVSTPTGSPAIAKNQAETEALVKDGQTLVMGGIYVINKSDRESRTPYLHRLPVLGWLFHNNLIRDIRKELLIFVTPRIVRTPEVQDA